ncbi:MAG: VTT domain-containing protein [Planctomycetota bacterium]|nr:VTT domain-containing protein [Planctomycetota bacterium]
MQQAYRRASLGKLANLLLFTCVLLALGTVLWSFSTGGLATRLFSGSLSPEAKLAHLREFFLSFGTAAPVAYIGLTTVEVVIAPLPGLLLYAPGGIIFGGFWGGLLSLAGNILGSAIACHLTRSLRSSFATRLPHKPSVQRLQQRLSDHGLWVVFLLRVNPLTSSDLVSYAAGLTSLPTWKVCLGTGLGLAPLCWLQAYAADGLMQTYPQLLSPLIVLCVLYMLVAVGILWRALRTPTDPPSTPANSQSVRPRC